MLTLENDLYLLETLERVIEKGIALTVWKEKWDEAIIVIGLRVVVEHPDDDNDHDDGGSGLPSGCD